jgi:hypothetical protein
MTADGGGYVHLSLGAERIQLWREADDLTGRTVMGGASGVV